MSPKEVRSQSRSTVERSHKAQKPRWTRVSFSVVVLWYRGRSNQKENTSAWAWDLPSWGSLFDAGKQLWLFIVWTIFFGTLFKSKKLKGGRRIWKEKKTFFFLVLTNFRTLWYISLFLLFKCKVHRKTVIFFFFFFF